MPDPSRLGIERLLIQPRDNPPQHRGGSAARGSRQQAPSAEQRWRLTVVEGFVDTVVDGIGGRSGSTLGQRLRRQAAAHGGGGRRTEPAQPASNDSYYARFYHRF